MGWEELENQRIQGSESKESARIQGPGAWSFWLHQAESNQASQEVLEGQEQVQRIKARFAGVPRPSPSISSSHQTIHGRRWTETLDSRHATERRTPGSEINKANRRPLNSISLHDHDRTTLPSFQL